MSLPLICCVSALIYHILIENAPWKYIYQKCSVNIDQILFLILLMKGIRKLSFSQSLWASLSEVKSQGSSAV